MSDTPPAFVVDYGSLHTRVGFSDEPEPAETVLSVVGIPKSRAGGMVNVSDIHKSTYFGAEAIRHRAVCTTTWPVDAGNVRDWDRMAQLIDYSYTAAGVLDHAQHDVVVVDPITSSREQRARIASIILETYNASGIYFASAGVMGLFSTGRTCGVAFESGEAHTVALGVMDGVALPHAMRKNEITGYNVTHYLTALLSTHVVSSARDSGREMKEKYSFVPIDYSEETRKCNMNPAAYTQLYDLPDGQFVELTHHCFSCTEPLFNPSVQYGTNSHYEGFAATAMHALTAVPQEYYNVLRNNIVLCGGNTMIRGFADRMQLELSMLSGEPCVVDGQKASSSSGGGSHSRVKGCNRNWKGSALLANLSTFSDLVVRRADCEENGYDIVCANSFYDHK